VASLADAKGELREHVREQIQVAEAHVGLYSNITSIAFDTRNTPVGAAAAAVAAGTGTGLGAALTLPGAGAAAAAVSAGGESAAASAGGVVSGVVHMFHRGEIRPFAFDTHQCAAADVANALWDAMWLEQCAKKGVAP